ncbi:MAG: hypothetical protein LW817_02255 [Candidatus Caenarcaniphilales bacterium]|jgi:hypothetical protein|nr:hypothetical protein [Candidatus Caenarcaniphilales bacterium]
MSQQQVTYQPGTVSTKLVRDLEKGQALSTAIKNTGISSPGKSIHNLRSEESPFSKSINGDTRPDAFLDAQNNPAKANEERSVKDFKQAALSRSRIEEFAKKTYQQASTAAQAVATMLLPHLSGKYGLSFLAIGSNLKDPSNPQAQKEQAEAKLMNLVQNPDQIPKIMMDVIGGKISEDKKLAKANGDDKALADIEKTEENLNPIFDALNDLQGNGSHEKLFGLVAKMSYGEIEAIGPKFKELISGYKDSLFNIMQTQKRYVGITKDVESKFLKNSGIDPKVDRAEFRNCYARKGGEIADRNYGGILGKMFNYMEDAVAIAGAPFEFKPNEYGVSGSSLTIRRLLPESLAPAQNRTYTGVGLDERNPMPGYVYVDSEIPIRGDLPVDDMYC